MKTIRNAASLARLGALALPAMLALPAAAQEGRCTVSAGVLSPSGPAKLGTFVGFNYGMPLSDSLRIGAEIDWYRRDYDSSFLLVTGEDGSGTRELSVASTNLFPFLATADYTLDAGGRGMRWYLGGGLGFHVLRTRHYPRVAIPDFTRTLSGLGYLLHGGVETRPGRGSVAFLFEAFYLGSTIDGEKDFVPGRAIDTESRADGPGLRIGFRW